ncbi:HD domain-containing protein [Mycolicibacterium sp. CBMA 226]|uniref:HD domain-containing protein n=1 Tax=Mycolicibacterium sp. CBMA 226 TaxID=2606611 RepID=UPI0012DCE4D7|nr:HD domain-containing protein [Mycolicibacterium sp. CBMA 226]MUL79572.1 HD domain-containing protein [Mycolicibacterium sp. CBMA 226]
MHDPMSSRLIAEALNHLRGELHPAILNHSVRVHLIASHLGAESLDADDQLALAVASLFHDSGTAEIYNGDLRFEVEGANAAVRFLHASGYERLATTVWQAIALHTSPGIAEHMQPVIRYTRLGVLEDFGHGIVEVPDRSELDMALAKYDRLDIEEVLGRAVVSQALRNPAKAPTASWPGQLLAAHVADPDRPGINPAF